ncbi:ig-like domain-containing protein [Caerostris extrusa]|uniref:Ig-like domain-containing protein n=1 Tax=Caerostris extrusa TaxID=172846 RepID=A0AAV4VLX3_CAEEX|nr:ig-like domain-containing protein [Caerostris extrusa]
MQPEIYQNDLETSKSRLFFVVDPSHLRHGTLSLQCTAEVSLIHSKSSIELIVNDGSSGAEFLHGKRKRLCMRDILNESV